jgi:aminoglycoside phosphotransferase (APT) family kinase protein
MTHDRPWLAEIAMDVEQAARVVARRFPEFAGRPVERLGQGWDNLAVLVDGTWVFRLPRRHLAVPLLRHEARVLPALAPRLPLAVPVPVHMGEADDAFAYPCVGYRRLAGEVAAEVGPDGASRVRAAPTLGAFVAALHRTPRDLVDDPPADELRRADLRSRLGPTLARIAAIRTAASGALGRAAPLLERLVETEPHAGAPVWSHGDLSARHVLVDAAGDPTGVLDWGDVHLGDPAVDLSIGWTYFPPAGREAFLGTYGAVDDATWRRARFRALFQVAAWLVWGEDVVDARLLAEARRALDWALDD